MISLEDIAHGPVGTVFPLKVTFNKKDGSVMTCLYPENSTGSRQVFAYGKSTNFQMKKMFNAESRGELSVEEQLRRERMRLFVSGVATYEWGISEDGELEFIMIPMNGEILLYIPSTERLVCVYNGSQGGALDPQLCPKGKSLTFVLGRDLYTVPLNVHLCASAAEEDNSSWFHEPIRLTESGMQPGISCGLADYVAQEEMDRYRGFWYSPDGAKLAYCKVDDNCVPEYQILHQGKESPTHFEAHRYPFAGATNPKVELAVLTLPCLGNSDDGGAIVAPSALAELSSVWLDLTAPTWTDPEYYMARCDWWPDGSVMAQVEDRRQHVLELLRIDPVTGKRQVLLEERRPEVYINLHNLWQPLSLKQYRGTAPYDFSKEELEGSGSEGGFGFVWGSERSGFMQLYLYKFEGGSGPAELYSSIPIGGGGDWVVDTLNCVDVARNRVYMSGNKDDPCGSQLYVAPLTTHSTADGITRTTPIVRLTNGRGMHSCTVSKDALFFCDIHSTVAQPYMTHVRPIPDIPSWEALSAGDGGTAATKIFEDTFSSSHARGEDQMLYNSATDDRFMALGGNLRPPVVWRVPGAGGKPLYCALYLPPGVNVADVSGKPCSAEYIGGVEDYGHPCVVINDGYGGDFKKSLPCAVSVYGGPHVQRVQHSWSLTADMRAQRLASRGFVVLRCDNRGSSRRGLVFEGSIRYDMGHLEVDDQVTAVNFFSGKTHEAVADGVAVTGLITGIHSSLIDPMRVGIFGWSYGGYMSAMALCRAPDIFRVAVAGAPVTHWDAYDTHYTERYMGLPQENTKGYESSAVMSHVSGLKPTSRLMLVHGLIDENVHFRHTARLINKLIKVRARYDLVLFPCERHSPHKISDRVYLEDRICSYLEKELDLEIA